MKSLSLKIITPEKTVFSGPVSSMTVPAVDGGIGILPGHAPLVTALDTGRASVTGADGKVTWYAISGGFLEVADNEVRVLADVGEPGDEIDEERARKAEQRARERLRERKAADFDLARAEAALARAVTRLRLAEFLKRR